MNDVIEAAKSGRATCRTCREKIAKDALRFGEAMNNQFDPDGGMSHVWHHLVCAAKRLPQRVKPVLEAFGGEVPDRAEVEKALTSGGGAKAAKVFPYAEKAPSGRSRCMECDAAIEKGSWRVAVEREIDTGSFTTTGAGYLHPACAESHIDGWDAVEKNSGVSAEDMAALRAAATAAS